MVVLVACTPSVEWSSWWALARSISGRCVHGGSRKRDLTRVPMNQALSQRSTTPAIGQGSNALLKARLISMTLVGQICVVYFICAQVGVCRTQFDTVRLWVWCVVTLHLVRHTISPRGMLAQAHNLSFVPPAPSLLCAGLVTTDNPRCWV